jgi:GntR family transcriptional regulator, rspAB operon transcriptional repressor
VRKERFEAPIDGSALPPSSLFGDGPMPSLRASRAASVRAQVYATMRTAIVRVKLIPGQRLTEKEIAGELGVSRTPVRESLIQLVDEGLVDVLPQIGTFVSQISLPRVRQAQWVREVLECAALRLAVDRVRPEDLARLRLNLERQHEAHAGDDLDWFQELDEELHRTLMDRSGHVGVWRITERAKAHLDRARRLSLPVPATIGELIDQHEGIVALVSTRDSRAAEAALRAHLRMVLHQLGSLQRQHPDFFNDLDNTTMASDERQATVPTRSAKEEAT